MTRRFKKVHEDLLQLFQRVKMCFELLPEVNHPLKYSIQCGPSGGSVSGQNRVVSIKLFTELLEAHYSTGLALEMAANFQHNRLYVNCQAI